MNATPTTLRSHLAAHGLTLESWAKAHGYTPRTVRNVVQRYVGHPEKKPWGGTTYAVLRDLSRELGTPLHPLVREQDLAA